MSKAKKETIETIETVDAVETIDTTEAVEAVETVETEPAPEGRELTFSEVMAWQRENRHLMPPLKELPAEKGSGAAEMQGSSNFSLDTVG